MRDQAFYKALLRCYPAAFRDEYGNQMCLMFAEQLGEARRTGGVGGQYPQPDAARNRAFETRMTLWVACVPRAALLLAARADSQQHSHGQPTARLPVAHIQS